MKRKKTKRVREGKAVWIWPETAILMEKMLADRPHWKPAQLIHSALTEKAKREHK